MPFNQSGLFIASCAAFVNQGKVMLSDEGGVGAI